MAIALHTAAAKYGLLALLIFTIGTLLQFSFPDSLHLSDLQNFHDYGPDEKPPKQPQPPPKPFGDEGPEADSYEPDHGLGDIQNSTLGVQIRWIT